jgi:hypothetical protein
MKKLFAIVLAFVLLLALAACGAAETPAAETPADGTPVAETPAAETDAPGEPSAPETPDAEAGVPDDPSDEFTDPDVTGLWYCAMGTVDLCLELESGGAYTVTLPHDPEGTVTGTWEERDGFLYLDGDETAPLSTYGTLLSWPAAGVFLSREEPAPLYVPAQKLEKLPEGSLDGYWVAAYLELDGEVFSVDDLNERMDLYVEGSRAALGGPVFGDRIVDLDVRENGLGFSGEGFRVDMSLQADGFLRLSMEAEGEGALVYYLYSAGPADEAEIEGE